MASKAKVSKSGNLRWPMILHPMVEWYRSIMGHPVVIQGSFSRNHWCQSATQFVNVCYSFFASRDLTKFPSSQKPGQKTEARRILYLYISISIFLYIYIYYICYRYYFKKGGPDVPRCCSGRSSSGLTTSSPASAGATKAKSALYIAPWGYVPSWWNHQKKGMYISNYGINSVKLYQYQYQNIWVNLDERQFSTSICCCTWT